MSRQQHDPPQGSQLAFQAAQHLQVAGRGRRRELGPDERRSEGVAGRDHQVVGVEVAGRSRGVTVQGDDLDRAAAQLDATRRSAVAVRRRSAVLAHGHPVRRRSRGGGPVQVGVVDGATGHLEELAGVITVGMGDGHVEVHRIGFDGAVVAMAEQMPGHGAEVVDAHGLRSVLRGVDQQGAFGALEQPAGGVLRGNRPVRSRCLQHQVVDPPGPQAGARDRDPVSGVGAPGIGATTPAVTDRVADLIFGDVEEPRYQPLQCQWTGPCPGGCRGCDVRVRSGADDPGGGHRCTDRQQAASTQTCG